MNITISELSEATAELDAFKAAEWPQADKEHYGDHPVDFSRHKHIFTATLDSSIVGYITLEIDAGVAHIKSLIVGQAHRRKGYAAALLQTAEEKARSLGAHKSYLETGVSWEARALYEKAGYRERTVLPNHFGNQDFVLLEKFFS